MDLRVDFREFSGLVISVCAFFFFCPGASAIVHSGLDTLQSGSFSGMDFATQKVSNNRPMDFEFVQLQDYDARTARPGHLIARPPAWIVDMGPVSLDSLMVIPLELAPDPATASFNMFGTFLGWSPVLYEKHLYVVWTRYGGYAKVLIENIIPIDEFDFKEYVSNVVFRWSYQDDGSRSFEPVTSIPAQTWGVVKNPAGKMNE